jgi:hypothetical protein
MNCDDDNNDIDDNSVFLRVLESKAGGMYILLWVDSDLRLCPSHHCTISLSDVFC